MNKKKLSNEVIEVQVISKIECKANDINLHPQKKICAYIYLVYNLLKFLNIIKVTKLK